MNWGDGLAILGEQHMADVGCGVRHPQQLPGDHQIERVAARNRHAPDCNEGEWVGTGQTRLSQIEPPWPSSWGYDNHFDWQKEERRADHHHWPSAGLSILRQSGRVSFTEQRPVRAS